VEYGGFVNKGTTYLVGESVYLPEDCHAFPGSKPSERAPKYSRKGGPDPSDEVKYPELYRKSEYVKGSNSDVPKPFQIGECLFQCNSFMRAVMPHTDVNQYSMCVCVCVCVCARVWLFCL